MCFVPQRRAMFPSLIWPDGSAPAALASLLFDPPEPQIIGKTQWIATFLLFPTPLHLLSSDSFSTLIFSLLLFSSLTLITSAFPSVHIVGSLTSSKLPSSIYLFIYLYLFIFICIDLYQFIFTYIYLYLFIYIYIYLYLFIYIYLYLSLSLYIFIYMYLYLYLFTFIFIYIYFIFIFIFIDNFISIYLVRY